MALWQVDYQVIPKEKDCFESQDNVLKIANEILREMFPIEKSWDTDTTQFGIVDGTCVEITLYDDVTEIRCRFDMRNLTKKQLNTIIDFVSSIRGEFQNGNKKYDAEWNVVVKALKSSEEFRICENPQKFFDDISMQK